MTSINCLLSGRRLAPTTRNSSKDSSRVLNAAAKKFRDSELTTAVAELDPHADLATLQRLHRAALLRLDAIVWARG